MYRQHPGSQVLIQVAIMCTRCALFGPAGPAGYDQARHHACWMLVMQHMHVPAHRARPQSPRMNDLFTSIQPPGLMKMMLMHASEIEGLV